jgi:dienelactone hydrolase
MPTENHEFHFSPSVYHRFVMDHLPSSLRYDGGDVEHWESQLREMVRQLIGVTPVERPPLNVRSLWQRDHPLGTIEKIVFTSEPFCDVPAYVCIPGNVPRPLTSVICLQGYTTGMHVSIGVDSQDEITPIEVDGDRDFAIGCLKRSIAALCVEQRSFGERVERKQAIVNQDSGCHDAAMQALMLGRTLIGERVHDVDRAIDYLDSRGDIAMDRIGVMGNSGGGTVTMFSAAVLPRIAFAMPSCSFCTFRDSIMSIWHCADNYIPGLLKFAEMADIMGLFAPKPVVIVAGEEDDIFPIAGTRRAFADLQRIYTAAGAADGCHLIVGKGGHRFYAEDAWPVLSDEIHRL